MKILPIYFLILLGFIAGKKFKIESKQIASLLIYFLAPVVVFSAVANTVFKIENISLPIIFLLLGSVICFMFFQIGKKIWKDGNEKNLLALSSGQGNTGYFGLPLILSLFGDKYFVIAVFITLGSILFENTVGYFIISRGKYSALESLKKIFTLPSVYAFIFGALASIFSWKFNLELNSLFLSFKGAYIVLGMMMVGFGLSTIKKHDFDFKLVAFSFLAKFLVWPICIAGVILFDKNFTHLYSPMIQNIMLILSVVPIASNTVSYASLIGVKPEKASIIIFLSTIFSLFYIPIFIALFIS